MMPARRGIIVAGTFQPRVVVRVSPRPTDAEIVAEAAMAWARARREQLRLERERNAIRCLREGEARVFHVDGDVQTVYLEACWRRNLLLLDDPGVCPSCVESTALHRAARDAKFRAQSLRRQLMSLTRRVDQRGRP